MEKLFYIFMRIVINALQLIIVILLEKEKNSQEKIQQTFDKWYDSSVNFLDKLP